VFISTVVAVALGITPLNDFGRLPIAADYASQVGHYQSFVDRHGVTHIKGSDRRGIPYDLVMDKRGYVEATFGERVITFRVQEAS
jgi:hypothetical protein